MEQSGSTLMSSLMLMMIYVECLFIDMSSESILVTLSEFLNGSIYSFDIQILMKIVVSDEPRCTGAGLCSGIFVRCVSYS